MIKTKDEAYQCGYNTFTVGHDPYDSIYTKEISHELEGEFLAGWGKRYTEHREWENRINHKEYTFTKIREKCPWRTKDNNCIASTLDCYSMHCAMWHFITNF